MHQGSFPVAMLHQYLNTRSAERRKRSLRRRKIMINTLIVSPRMNSFLSSRISGSEMTAVSSENREAKPAVHICTVPRSAPYTQEYPGSCQAMLFVCVSFPAFVAVRCPSNQLLILMREYSVPKDRQKGIACILKSCRLCRLYLILVFRPHDRVPLSSISEQNLSQKH